LGRLWALGRPLPGYRTNRAPGDAAVRALLADSLRQGRGHERRRARGGAAGARRRVIATAPHVTHLRRHPEVAAEGGPRTAPAPDRATSAVILRGSLRSHLRMTELSRGIHRIAVASTRDCNTGN